MNQKNLCAVSLSLLLSITPTVSCATGFKDTSTHWAKSYIEYFQENKIVADVQNNTFYPEQNMTMEVFLKTLYSSINISDPTLLYPEKMQANGDTYNKSTKESNIEISNEQDKSLSSTNVDESITKQEEVNTLQEDDAGATLNETTVPTSSAQEGTGIPVVTTVSQQKLSIPFQDSYIELVTSTLYENGLLQFFTLDDKFLSSPLSRHRAVLICKNYDALRQSRGINSDRTSWILEKNAWINSETGKLLSPNQVLTRGESMKIIYELLQDEALPHNHKVELEVPHISQMTPVCAPVGCEPVSLLMCLRSKGYCKMYLSNLT